MPRCIGRALGNLCDHDPWQLARKLNLSIHYMPLAGMPEVIRGRNLCLPPETSGDTVLLAHLLAHFVMVQPSPWDEQQEREAVEFADAFLGLVPVT